MAQAAPHPRPATLNRSQTVQSLIQRVFSVTYGHLSELRGRTIREYCQSQAEIPSYIERYFTGADYRDISTAPPEEYSVKLIHKLLKTCCGLMPPRHERWKPKKAEDTFEYLITFCWTEYENLHQGTAVTDDDLNIHMDKILEALVLLIEKIEKKENVEETALKTELRNHIEEKLDSYDNAPCFHHMYTILCGHAVKQMLVMVYNQLNQLCGRSLSKYLDSKGINPIPKTGFSNEREFLAGNPPPKEMPVGILFRVVPRVCFPFELRRTRNSLRIGLEKFLHNLKQEYNSPPRNEEEYTNKCYKVYELLETIIQSLCNKTGKKRKLVIGTLCRETFVVASIQKPFEHPVPCQDGAPSPPDTCASPEESLASSDTASAVVTHTRTTPEKGALTVEDVNVCVLFKVMRPGGLVSQTLALVFKELKGDIESTKRNKKMWKNAFTSDEKDLIQNGNNNDLSARDLTFLCKVLRHGCSSLSADDDVWLTKSDMMEYHITAIRKERNKLAHDVSSMKTEELNDTLAVIEDSLLTILEKAEIKLKDDKHETKDIQNHKDKVKSEIQKFSQISNYLSYKNEWTEMNEMRNQVMTAAQEELQQQQLYGESLQCLSPISGSSDLRHKSLTIDQVFVQRQLEDKNDIKADGTTYRIEDMLSCQNSAPLASFRVFIVHGRPGDGKTTICKYLFHLWSKNIKESSQKGIDMLFYIPCRYVTTKSLSSYLKARFPKTFEATKTDDIIPLLQEPQVLFVIDGYDEAGEDAKDLIDEILTCLPDSKVIITTKTQWLPKLTELARRLTTFYKVLNMVQLTKENRTQYAIKIFCALKRDTEDCNEFLKFFEEMKEILNFLIHRPLTLSLLALLWIEEPGSAKTIRTLAQLYYRLTDLILERVTKQLGKDDTFLCREWMITLGELAWGNLNKKKHFLGEKDQTPLKRKAEKLGLGVEGNNHLVSSLLYCEIQDSLTTTEKRWTFTFTSQQEYFAAEYIVDRLKNDKTTSLRNILDLSEKIDENYKKKLQRLIPVIELICGLWVIHDAITESGVRELTEIMSVQEPWCFCALQKIFKNSLQENSQMKAMFEGETISTFDNFEPQSTLWVLKNTSVDVHEEVTLKNDVSDLQQLKPLLGFLLLKSPSIKVIKVMVNIDKNSYISNLSQFTEEKGYKDIRFFFAPWKPHCISELILTWPFSSPLCMCLCPELFPLVWWESLMCLLTMTKKVTKLVCSPRDPKCFQLIKEGAATLEAEVVEDPTLAPTEVVIHTSP